MPISHQERLQFAFYQTAKNIFQRRRKLLKENSSKRGRFPPKAAEMLDCQWLGKLLLYH